MKDQLYIGVDLGTSAVKLLLVNGEGTILNSVSKEYALAFPNPGWCEQNAEDWWKACVSGIHELLKDADASQVKGIGCGGQMHGLVVLDKEDKVIRPVILWNDGRTTDEVSFLNDEIGTDKISGYTANIAFAGFTAPKLLWMKKHEPEFFERIAKIMLPKDYINYLLTGVHASDYSDASGLLLLDVEHRTWSREMLSICGIREEQLPHLYESYEVIGTVLPEAAEELGIPSDVKVIAGAGDNAAAAVGTGCVGNGDCNISLGTSGTIFISNDEFCVDSHNALHSFAHANGKYHLMGVALSAASCNKWFCDEILKTKDYPAEQKDITDDRLGRNSVFFLPYLMGERSPINDVDARGTFTGLSMDTTRADMVQAVLEGVTFAIRDSFEVAKALGVKIEKSKLCGGGGKSPLWRKIVANVLNIPIEIPSAEEGPGYGGAMLAMVGCGAFESVQACADALVSTAKVIEPDPQIAARYDEQYHKFQKIYPAMKQLFKELR